MSGTLNIGSKTLATHSTANNTISINNDVVLPDVVLPAGVSTGIAILTEEYASGTYGTAITTGDFRKRNLNTIRYNGQSVVTSLSSGQFALPAGDYYFNSIVHNYGTREIASRIYNITDSTEVARGLVGFSYQSEGQSDLIGAVSISSPKTFELQNRIYQTNSSMTNGTYWSVGTSVNCHLTIIRIA